MKSCCSKKNVASVPPEPFVMDLESPSQPTFESGSVTVTSTGAGTWRAVSNTPLANFWIGGSANNSQITKMTLIKSDGLTNMYHAFRSNNGSTYLSSLQTVVIKPSADTSQVTSMRQAFSPQSGSGAITNLDLSGLNTSSVEDMAQMFTGVNASSVDVSGFNTANVTNMSSMFETTQLIDIDISNFSIASVTSMSYMFGNYYNNEPIKTIKMPISMTGSALSGIDMGNMFRDNRMVVCIDRLNTLIASGTSYLFLRANSLESPNATEQGDLANTRTDWVGSAACPSCNIESGTNLTFTVTLGQSSSGYIGYSDGNGYASNDSDQVFGSISVIDDTSGLTEFRYYAAEEPNTPAIYGHSGYNSTNTVFVNGVAGKPYWTAADIGQTFCVSLNIYQGD